MPGEAGGVPSIPTVDASLGSGFGAMPGTPSLDSGISSIGSPDVAPAAGILSEVSAPQAPTTEGLIDANESDQLGDLWAGVPTEKAGPTLEAAAGAGGPSEPITPTTDAAAGAPAEAPTASSGQPPAPDAPPPAPGTPAEEASVDAAAAGAPAGPEPIPTPAEAVDYFHKGFTADEIAQDKLLYEKHTQDPKSLNEDEQEQLKGFEARRNENAFQHLNEKLGRGETLSPDEQDSLVAHLDEKRFNTTRPADALTGETYNDYLARKNTPEAPTEIPEDPNKAKLDLQTQRDAALAELKANPNAENLKKVEDLNGKISDLDKDPEALKKSAIEKLGRREPLSDAERAALTGQESAPLTPEQQAEALNKQIDALGDRLAKKLMSGEALSAEDLKEMQSLSGQAKLIETGLTPDQAKAALKEALSGPIANERRTLASREIQEKLQELMTIEYRIMSIPKSLEPLRQRRQEIRDAADKAHKDAQSGTDEERAQKRMVEYNLMAQIDNVNTAIVGQKNMARRLDAKRLDLQRQVRRATGMTGGIRAVGEWAASKTNLAMTEIYSDIEDEIDYRVGVN